MECCKIIYTSRNKGLWAGQQTKKEIPLPILSDKESLDLFMREVNLNNDDADFQMKNEIAISIVNECKGLPLALKVAGGALIKKEMDHWHDMLFRLKNHHEHDSKINEVLETSYNSLEHNEKLVFLLCCLFKEETNISIEMLYRYAVGLQFFEDMITLREIRSRIYTLVGNLIRRNLLTKDDDFEKDRNTALKMFHIVGDRERLVAMHDVVRDVGISIAKSTNGFSNFVCDGLKDVDSVIGVKTKTKMISILFSGMDLRMLNGMGLGYSKFELLKLEDYFDSMIDISKDSFQGMDITKVLHVVNLRPWRRSHPYFSYLLKLKKLKMLSLEHLNIITSLFAIEKLSCLEILSLRQSKVKVFHKEIGELTNLRLLDLTSCVCFIQKGVISQLTNLEELYMWHSFMDWRVPQEQNFRSTTYDIDAAELIELNRLNKLWRLELMVSNIKQVQRGVNLLSSSKLLQFKISIEGEKSSSE